MWSVSFNLVQCRNFNRISQHVLIGASLAKRYMVYTVHLKVSASKLMSLSARLQTFYEGTVAFKCNEKPFMYSNVISIIIFLKMLILSE